MANVTFREWMPNDKEFGARLALVRQGMGWNMKEAAEACGLSPASWRKWETWGSKPRDYMEVSRAVSEHTGVSLEWLVFGHDFRVNPNEQLPNEPMVEIEDENGGTAKVIPLRELVRAAEAVRPKGFEPLTFCSGPRLGVTSVDAVRRARPFGTVPAA